MLGEHKFLIFTSQHFSKLRYSANTKKSISLLHCTESNKREEIKKFMADEHAVNGEKFRSPFVTLTLTAKCQMSNSSKELLYSTMYSNFSILHFIC